MRFVVGSAAHDAARHALREARDGTVTRAPHERKVARLVER